MHHNIIYQIISVKHEYNSISSHSLHSALQQYLHHCLLHPSSHFSSFHFLYLLTSPPFCLFLLQPFTFFRPHYQFLTLTLHCSSSTFAIIILLFPLTHLSLFFLIFLSEKSILLLAADTPAGQDVGVTEAKAEPRVAGRGVPHVQGDRLVAVMELKRGHQQCEVQVEVRPLGVVPQVLGVEVQDPLPCPA